MLPSASLLLILLQAHAADKTSEWVYIGTRAGAFGQPATGMMDQGSGPQGIYAARLDTRTGRLSPLGLAVGLERATRLLTHPGLPVLYSTADPDSDMAGESTIHAFRVDQASGKLLQISRAGSGGLDATDMHFDAASKTLFVANHNSGSVSALPLLADGGLGPVASRQADFGTGPSPRQKTPQAHGVAVDPTHRYVLVPDFGADRLFVYHFEGATRTLSPAQVPFEPLPPGSGPRHLQFHPNGRFLYLDTEMSAEVRTYRWDAAAGRLQLLQTLSPYPAGYAGEKSAAELAISRDGGYLYLSLRGDQDSIIVYAINQRSGALKEMQRVPAGGKSPWSFGIEPTGHWMLVTNIASNSVNELRIDPTTGKLSATSESLSIPVPASVAFYAN
jgi:6-phosphogluconolactonase